MKWIYRRETFSSLLVVLTPKYLADTDSLPLNFPHMSHDVFLGFSGYFPLIFQDSCHCAFLDFWGHFSGLFLGTLKVLQPVSVRVDWVIKCSLFQLQWQGFTSSPLPVINYSLLIIDTWFILYSIYLYVFISKSIWELQAS